MVDNFFKIASLTALLVCLFFFESSAQSYIENCDLTASFKKQINEWKSQFHSKIKISDSLCIAAVKSYQTSINRLNESKCDSKDSLLVLLNKESGTVYRNCNKNQKAITQYQKALKIANKCNNCNDTQKAHTMFNMAQLKRLQKDYAASEQYFHLASSVYKKLKRINDICDVWLELLTTYEGYPVGHHKLDSIFNLISDKCDQATKIGVQVNYLAEKHIKNKKYEAAHQIYDKALNYYLNDSSYINWLTVNINKANLLIKQNKPNQALPIFDEIESIKQKHQLSTKLFHKEADLLLTKAAYHTALKQYHQAQLYHQQILQFINPLFTYQTIYQNPNPNQIFGNPYLLTTLADKAEIFKKMYYQSGDKENLKHALDSYQLNYNAADEMRKNYSFEDANTYLSDYTYSYYEKAIELCQTLAKVYPEQKNYYQQKAFEVAQRSSMKTLFWEINSRFAENNLPQAIKIKLNELRKEITNLESKIKEDLTNGNLESGLFNKKQQLEASINEAASLTVYNKFKPSLIKEETIQNKLQANQAFLNYFYGDSLIYCFLITQNKFKIIEIENPGLVSNNVIAFRKAIEENENDKIKNLSHQLYQQLLEKALAIFPTQIFNTNPINNLIIIPSGILNALPFEVLRETNESQNYLLNSYTISYDLHSSFLIKQESQSIPKPKKVIAFSVEDFINWGSDRFENLTYSNKEVNGIIDQIGGDKIFNPTKQAFIQNFNIAAIIHISTHATADTLEAANSRIYFSRISDIESDDYINRNEILNYKIEADMVVLSACETGLGKQNRGEGIASFARAFRTIGSKSEVISLWKVNEYSTAQIMIDFYKNLKAGLPKNEALRKAKLNFINNVLIDSYKSPKYWAGFVLQGNSSSLF